MVDSEENDKFDLGVKGLANMSYEVTTEVFVSQNAIYYMILLLLYDYYCMKLNGSKEEW